MFDDVPFLLNYLRTLFMNVGIFLKSEFLLPQILYPFKLNSVELFSFHKNPSRSGFDCTITVAATLPLISLNLRALSIKDSFKNVLYLHFRLCLTLYSNVLWRPGYCISQKALVCNSVLCFKVEIFHKNIYI